jgi:cytochrome c oxidase assembly protein subunit 15
MSTQTISDYHYVRVLVDREQTNRALVRWWLYWICVLVFLMVMVGGATRLTDSGLSITEWKPIHGIIPPLSAAEWQEELEKYRQIPEYQQINKGMSMAEFQFIYWWEWGHRFLGRLIGLVWFVGFLGFLLAGRIPEGWTGRLLLVGVLGGLQGAIGWWMVASGLTGRLDVAPYRLAAHLGLAFVIFALLFWYALRIRHDAVDTLQRRRRRVGPLMGWSSVMIVLVFVQILSGALVAGLDAGRGFVDWPLMEGAFFPDSGLDMEPLWVNVFENPGLAQFDHRMLAYLILVVAILFVMRCARAGHAKIRAWGVRVGVTVLAQVIMGIVTVMHAAPLGLALAHQALALILVGALIHARFEIAYPSEQKIRG